MVIFWPALRKNRALLQIIFEVVFWVRWDLACFYYCLICTDPFDISSKKKKWKGQFCGWEHFMRIQWLTSRSMYNQLNLIHMPTPTRTTRGGCPWVMTIGQSTERNNLLRHPPFPTCKPYCPRSRLKERKQEATFTVLTCQICHLT